MPAICVVRTPNWGRGGAPPVVRSIPELFPRPSGAKGIGGASGPRVALRFTRGYRPQPRWG